jgi:glutathione S-transferase
MTDLILHHYAGSPFSEKVRLILGYKGLSWKSVTVPVTLPKPDVVALTGGYRRTPFMQIGADIYCDTALMCRVIDRLAPQPPLYPAASAGMGDMIAHWADTALFWCAVPYTMQPVGAAHMFAGAPPDFMKSFAADRAAMTTGMRRPTPADARAQLSLQLGWLELALHDGRPFLLGEAPCIADFSAAQSVWFIRRAPPVAEVLDPFAKVNAWFDRLAAMGHGTPQSLSSEQAISLAASATERAATELDTSQGFVPGTAVTVTPTDYAQDAVAGHLVGLNIDEVVISRTDKRAGTVHVHFPRVGYSVKKDGI